MPSEDEITIAEYRAKYGPGPFLAVDAVVKSFDNHFLLIKRSKAPQRGRWALPGGFVEPGEYLFHAAVRELREETGLNMSLNRHSLAGFEIFDKPDRDPRAHIVSFAYMFKPTRMVSAMPVQAADDAAEAVWIHEETLWNMRSDHFFADHRAIALALDRRFKD